MFIICGVLLMGITVFPYITFSFVFFFQQNISSFVGFSSFVLVTNVTVFIVEVNERRISI